VRTSARPPRRHDADGRGADFPDRVINGASMMWGERILHLTPSYYRVTVPAGLQNGEYIIRHEVRTRCSTRAFA
jgi:hypothetical protein